MSNQIGNNNSNWKGGLPGCVDCGKQLSSYAYKRCKKCYLQTLRGETHPFYGKKLSNEHKKKISINHVGFLGRHHSEETLNKMRVAAIGRPNYNPEQKGCFKKGHIPWSKLHPELIKPNSGSFKKGYKPSEETRQKYKDRIGPLSPRWQGGKSFEPYPLGWTKTFKEQIRQRDNYKCQICGCPEIECKRKLDVHHIDYIKENINPDNLTSLCRSCHVKTNNNREYWTKYFKELLWQ